MSKTYPKIQTLWNRDKTTFKVIPGEFRKPEFALVKRWLYTEKIDGTNIRIILHPNGNTEFRGRTDKAQMHKTLFDYLTLTFRPDKLHSIFERDDDGNFPEIVLFGEGYGPKIQRGGKYRIDVAFRLFDVQVGEWWLQWEDVVDIANKLGIQTVPVLGVREALPTRLEELENIIPESKVAFFDTGNRDILAEGIVARTDPILCDRRGERLFWKLKFRDL